VIRLALAAIVFCSTLCAAFGHMLPASPAADESSRVATGTGASLGCTPADDHREWTPPQDAAASLTESAWKGRTPHAAVAATSRPTPIIAGTLTESPAARAMGAPSYLLHIPLLI
jgi:hypothetical protein